MPIPKAKVISGNRTPLRGRFGGEKNLYCSSGACEVRVKVGRAVGQAFGHTPPGKQHTWTTFAGLLHERFLPTSMSVRGASASVVD